MEPLALVIGGPERQESSKFPVLKEANAQEVHKELRRLVIRKVGPGTTTDTLTFDCQDDLLDGLPTCRGVKAVQDPLTIRRVQPPVEDCDRGRPILLPQLTKHRTHTLSSRYAPIALYSSLRLASSGTRRGAPYGGPPPVPERVPEVMRP